MPARRPFEIRFWEKVIRSGPEDCWLWQAGKEYGYGRIGTGVGGGRILAHRASWEMHFGRVPEDLFVLHRCDVKLCVNPNHLFLGTNMDNVLDKVAKGRAARGEKSGLALLTERKVLEIVRLRTIGYTPLALAVKFGVKRAVIYTVINGVAWGWLTGIERKPKPCN